MILAEKGTRYGRLIAGEAGPRTHDGCPRRWCECDCGEPALVRDYLLVHGKTRSCGCLQRELTSNLHRIHGMAGTPEHAAWRRILQRVKDKPHYRHVEVAEEFTGPSGLQRFVEEIGPYPGPGYSVDRIDNARGYEPNNIRWATNEEQSRNKTSNVWITFNGRSILFVDLAAELGVTPGRLGWYLNTRPTVEQAVADMQRADACSTTVGFADRCGAALRYMREHLGSRYVRVPKLAAELGVSHPTARRYARVLVDQGHLVSRVTKAGRFGGRAEEFALSRKSAERRARG